jgi:hypothetical protein
MMHDVTGQIPATMRAFAIDRFGEPGMLADLVVLDRPYLAVPENEIHQLRSVLTLVDGTVVYASDEFAHLRGR